MLSGRRENVLNIKATGTFIKQIFACQMYTGFTDDPHRCYGFPILLRSSPPGQERNYSTASSLGEELERLWSDPKKVISSLSLSHHW